MDIGYEADERKHFLTVIPTTVPHGPQGAGGLAG